MSSQHAGHAHSEGMSDSRLVGAVIVNVLLTVAQIVGGVVSGSLSLIADALHNLNDAASLALALALVARKVGRRPADKLMTFGYGQAEVVAALINLTTLIIVGLYLVYEAIARFIEPQPVQGWIIVIVAGIALVIDVATALMVRVGAKHSLNIKAAFLHNVSDALASVGVIVAGTLILLYDLYVADLIVTLIIAAYVLYQGFSLLPRTIRLLMGATPDGVQFDKVVASIRAVDGIRDVHHVHIWSLGEHVRALEAHVQPTSKSIAEFAAVKVRVRAMLLKDHKIRHATLEACAPDEHAGGAALQSPHKATRPRREGRVDTTRDAARVPSPSPVQTEAHMTEGKPHLDDPSVAAEAGHKEGEASHRHGGIFGERTELIFAGLAGGALLAGWVLSSRAPGSVSLTLYILAYAFGGYFTVKEALDNLRRRRFAIDTLMLVAAAGAAALGEWAEGALLLALFSLGHALEHYAMGRARRAIEALAELAPERASRKRGDQVEDVPVAELELGDIVLVRPNERLPADGLVVAGESSVDQAPVTGESVPVDKRPAAADADFNKTAPEHRVFAGTINGAGALEVKVARLATESTLARVVKMVAEAEAQRSPTQRFTDRFERIFVPSVLVLVGTLMLAFLVLDEPFSVSFYRAMAVLVAASPCALAISVPSAVLSGVARAGRGGVLVKGGGPLENLGTLTALAFDKTGTLTEGKPKVTDIVPAIGVIEKELLETAAAVEAQSDHPLAAAVVLAAQERLGGAPLPTAEAVESLTGQGIRARVAGKDVHVGKPKLFDTLAGGGLPEEIASEAGRLEKQGRTVMVVRSGDRYLGVLGLLDTPREAAAEVVAQLRALGLRRIVMLSGDNQGVADAVAAKLGLDEAIGGMMPEDKVAFIKAMREKEGLVAMVGDGVNDAPAMANATVGIAMGAAGSDVALETADVALMADDLRHLPFAVGLSRQTSRIIRQNLWASLGMVAFLIPATLLGLKIGAAVVFHEGSTLLVVANALRLLAYRDRTRPGDVRA